MKITEIAVYQVDLPFTEVIETVARLDNAEHLDAVITPLAAD
ncbi:MAG: hypothetical protein ACE5NW_03625 [Acidiferrobacterales bacterium]